MFMSEFELFVSVVRERSLATMGEVSRRSEHPRCCGDGLVVCRLLKLCNGKCLCTANPQEVIPYPPEVQASRRYAMSQGGNVTNCDQQAGNGFFFCLFLMLYSCVVPFLIIATLMKQNHNQGR